MSLPGPETSHVLFQFHAGFDMNPLYYHRFLIDITSKYVFDVNVAFQGRVLRAGGESGDTGIGIVRKPESRLPRGLCSSIKRGSENKRDWHFISSKSNMPMSLTAHVEVQTKGHCFALCRQRLAPSLPHASKSKKTAAVCAFSRYSQAPGVSAAHALSLDYREQTGFFDADNGRNDGVEEKSMETSQIRVGSMPAEQQGDGKRAGAACAWPRACDVSSGPTSREMAMDAMKNTAVAAAISGAACWDKTNDGLYTTNNSVDTDLPVDVEMLALFSDSPRSWRLHEEPMSVKSETEELDQRSPIVHWIGTWWSRMWRYQGLGL